jgi:carboxypeptidase Q
MNKFKFHLSVAAFAIGISLHAQQPSKQTLQPIVENFVQEIDKNSQLELLAHELMDQVGPRLVGSPGGQRSHDWAIATFQKWNISAKNEKFGTWRNWERGISHIDMVSPWVKTLDATQLAWSPATKKPISAEVIAMPTFKSEADFKAWLPKIKGKIVLMSQNQNYGRSDYQYKEFATEESYSKITEEKKNAADAWKKSMEFTGFTNNTLPLELEKNGAAAVAISNWAGIMGANRIFGAKTKNIPMIDISNEDYGLLYRLAESGKAPKLNIDVKSENKGTAPIYNTIAEIKGKEKPNEYIILSAHIDSWDGSTGACDNGTGVITVMEAARVLQKYYPNNKRTILVCLWGSEEQGLNGSRAFVEDHPEIVQNTQALFNFDSGTGRIVRINGGGFEKSYDYMGRWLNAAPDYITKHIETNFPGTPGGGGSDHASFLAHGIPAFMMGSHSWGYFNYTWHTNRDSYDKIVFDDIEYNTILAATLVYMASEEPEMVNRDRRVMPVDKDGNPTKWPEARPANRTDDYYFVK